MQPISVHEYQCTWPAQFRQVAAELALRFSGCACHIEHIGSTSVPGLCAKPVIDIALGVQELAFVERRIDDIVRLGYTYRPEYEIEIPQRRYFVRPEGQQPRIHLHAVAHEGEIWRKHLAFRDALRTNPGLADAYAKLKKALAAEHSQNKAAYTQAKAPFIADVLATVMGTKPEIDINPS